MSEVVPLLDKIRILAAADFKQEVVDVPEWGGPIRLRGLSGSERAWCDKVLQDQQAGKGGALSYNAALVSCGAITAEGNAVFTRQEAASLSNKSYDVLDRLAFKVLELSGATLRTQQDTEKNFG